MDTQSVAARILVVDDYGDLLETIGELVAEAGYDVTLTTSGRKALRMHQARPFDVIVTDIFMPELDGLELILALRQSASPVRIVAMSSGGAHIKGLDRDEYLNVARIHGADRTLAKPIDSGALVAAIRELLSRESCGDDGGDAGPAEDRS